VKEADHGPFGLVVLDPESETSAPATWTDWLLFMVPLCISEMRNASEVEIDKVRAEAGEQIANHGDDAQFGGRHQASARTALAKGLALLAHAEGGVSAFGIHACTTSHDACPGERPAPAKTPDPPIPTGQSIRRALPRRGNGVGR
jgi:hypothetical protein